MTRIYGLINLKNIKRYEYGEFFASIDHVTDIPVLEKNDLGLSKEKIDHCMDLFRLINGSVMEMKLSGMKPKAAVKIITFEDRSCYALTFKNNVRNTDNSFCNGKIRLYVDRYSYEIVGIKLTHTPDTNYYKLVFNNFNCQSGILYFYLLKPITGLMILFQPK